MKTLLSSRVLFTLGFLLLLAANAILLTGVASNRSGEPFSRIILTERELAMPYDIHKEDSGLAFNLEWRTLGAVDEEDPYTIWGPPAWLDAEKLKELGFNLQDFQASAGETENYRHLLPKEAYIVLEYDGAPHREALKRTEANFKEKKALYQANSGNEQLRHEFELAEYKLKSERLSDSRLFAIDAGLDLEKLHSTYSDQSRFILVKGKIRARVNNYEKKKISGHIESLNINTIHVPLNQRRVLDTILVRSGSKKRPRYEVELAFGHRLEPWIVSVKTID